MIVAQIETANLVEFTRGEEGIDVGALAKGASPAEAVAEASLF